MEGDAGTRQLNPTDAEDTPDESVAVSDRADKPNKPPKSKRRSQPTETGRRRPAAIAPRRRLGGGHLRRAAGPGRRRGASADTSRCGPTTQIEAIARDDAAALQAAKDCVAATQAPDTAAMTAAQSKIIECSTGDFGAQASLYSSVLVEAYQAANVKVQVSDMRAAVERHNDDGSVDVLVAVRVKVTNSEAADQEQGYRLRVQMAPDEGTYKIAQLDQVTS